MADGIRATPYRYASAGTANDIIGGLLGYLRDPRRTQQMQGLAGLLESTGIPKTVERLAYGEPLTNLQQANVPTLRPETADALMTLLPNLPMAGKAIQATKGLPIGMSIKDVSKFDVVKRDASDIFGSGSQRIKYTDPKSGGTIEVLQKPDGTASVLGLEVPEKFRGKGIGEGLQSQVMKDFPEMMGQVSSKAAAKTAYRLGRRPPYEPNATLDDVYKLMVENSSVNLVSPEMQKRFMPELNQSVYPQEEALRLAQQRAALPIEQGGLGLPKDNTAEQRAAAMGFDTLFQHGTKDDITAFDLAKTQRSDAGYLGQGIYGGNIGMKAYADQGAYPLLTRSEGMQEITPSNWNINSPYKEVADRFVQAGFDTEAKKLAAQQYRLDKLNAGITGIIDRSSDGKTIDQIVSYVPDNIRSRFAAFDPFRRTAATAALYGVAAPDLLAAQQEQPTEEQMKYLRSLLD